MQLIQEKKVKTKFCLEPLEAVYKSATDIFDRIDHVRLIQTFIDLIKIPSPSGQEEGVRDYIVDRLEKLQLPYRVDQAGNVIAYKKGMQIHSKTVLINAHMDTVTPGEQINPIVGDDIITTDGTSILGADDKAGIAAILEGLEILNIENQYQFGNIKLIFTTGEENGLTGVKALTDMDLEADLGYVFDSDGEVGTIVHRGPTQEVFTLEIKGRASHAGLAPEKGINAIAVAGEIIANLPKGKINDETTVNIGTISGGHSTNVVPNLCCLKGEIRSHQDEMVVLLKKQFENQIKKITKKYGAQYDCHWQKMFSRTYLSKRAEVIENAENAARALGIDINIRGSNGGSDACIFNERGIPTAALGVGYEKAHSLGESIKISSLVQTTALMVEIIHQTACLKH